MALSKQQIDLLFSFTEKKLVRYYDLQIELVDHLANKIEEELEGNATLNFDDALKKVYATFGIFGFSKIVREKEEQVRRFNNKLWFTEFKLLFVWPNLLKSIGIFLIIKTLVAFINVEYILLWAIIMVLVESLVKFFYRKLKQKKAKNLLLTQHVFMPNFIGYLNFQILIHCWNSSFNSVFLAHNKLLITVIIFFVILCYLASVKVISKIYKKAMGLYPEAFVMGK